MLVMSRVFFFMGGISYPNDQHVETALSELLAGPDSAFFTQSALQDYTGFKAPPGSTADQLPLLEAAVPTLSQGHETILIGRSSGARTVSLFATRYPVSAVICLSYPFKPPGFVLQPERFSHLRDLATPALLLQGSHDRYGGLAITETYHLSASVTLRFFSGDHEFDLRSPACAEACGLIKTFVEGGYRQPPSPDPRFDEAFYLERFPDVAAAVAAGHLVSGEQHHRLYGRTEGRIYRVVPPTT